MENDVLRNKIAPYEEKGRWYKFRIINDNGSWTADNANCDVPISNVTSGGNVVGPTFHQINDMKSTIICNSVNAASSANVEYQRVRIHKTNGSPDMTLNIIASTPYEIEKELIIYIHGILANV